jgi:Ca2+-binding EF-hand superfamily protein
LNFDLDGNGTIEKDEFRKFLRLSILENENVSLTPHQIEKYIEDAYNKYDTNQDGSISFPEFVKGARKFPDIFTWVLIHLQSEVKHG